METERFTLEQIKLAFWAKFHKSGELWFNYLGSEQENEESTETEWLMFLDDLKKTVEACDSR